MDKNDIAPANGIEPIVGIPRRGDAYYALSEMFDTPMSATI